MVGQAFQFQRDGAQCTGPRGHHAAGQRLHRLAVRHGMADGGIARERFHVVDGQRMRPVQQRALDAAVLIAQRNFQMQHFLAVALEAEVARLDDSRMHGANGYFMNALARHTEKLHD
ncbi:MAG: hypothetical protein BWX54_01991 [Verrucomicrobia bacterium ADurb.Bin018]|nr:MAG: hypothetical protein BWX54_01991 [Verrucomicrobia bacterium ADurb.Bin018]